MKPLLLSIWLLLIASLGAGATLNRGVWFWGDSGSPWGSIAIVGDAAKENSTVTFLTGQGVKRVYGSYQNRPVSQPGTIAAWNAKLDAAGIQSQCLFSDNHLIFPSVRSDLLAKIENRVILFNFDPVRPVEEQFDAVHLDLEPQALPAWDTATPADKRGMLMDLRDTYADIRDLLVTSGYPSFPVYADLPVWFDKLPVDGGQIGWLDATDRDQWFSDIMDSLTGITLMPFEQTSSTAIVNSMSWEHANVTPAKIRIGHMCDVGATWTNFAHFKVMMYSLESIYGSRAVDIQSYRRWRESLFVLPGLTAVPITFELAGGGGGGGGDIVFNPGTKGTYVLVESSNLCGWVEVARVNLQQPREVRVPFEVTGPRKFWQVLEIGNPVGGGR